MTLNKKLFIIFAIIFVIFVASAFIINSIQPKENIAVITVDGEVVREVDLSFNQSFDIEAERGTNSVLVNGGKIYIASATCPDKLCVRHGELHNKYDTIVCLPNKVVIEYKTKDTIDAVAGR